MEAIKVILPAEISELALKVPESKQIEVKTILDSIFSGTEAWDKQVDAIEVKDINDKMSIQLADTARKNAKTARIDAEKIFDNKRNEVQTRMQDDKLEDALWLKSKQIMQLKLRHIEEKAKYKAEFVKRYEAEQLNLKVDERLSKVQKFNPDVLRSDIETLNDVVFDSYLSGLEKTYNDRIEAEKKAENERIEKEKVRIEEDKRIRAENEKLKKEADENERLAKIERERIQKEREAERKKQAEILAKQKEEKERIEKELRDKEKSEEEAKKEALAKDNAARLAPDKDKLIQLALTIKNIELPELKSSESKEILANIKILINKTVNYIQEKSNSL